MSNKNQNIEDNTEKENASEQSEVNAVEEDTRPVVISVKDVHKHFKVYSDKGHMLKDRIVHFNRNKYVIRNVLNGISFDVHKGEAVALIGKNGCGKSTTLKMLTRILRPNSGTIDIHGKVYSMIELGAGFHPDMTGRENVYINASIYGITDDQVDRKMDDIIRFSELEDVIDTPVRTYSSGMYMRLAFSIAINIEADILLVDEILAVGDQAFQTKCFNKLMSLKEEGTTIVLVSHSLDQVKKICDKVIWIDNGLIREEGSTYKVTKDYQEASEAERRARVREELKEEEKADKELLEKMNKSENGSSSSDAKADSDNAQSESNAGQDNKGKQSASDTLTKEQLAEIRKRELNRSCREMAEQCGPDARREGTQEAHYTYAELLDKNGERKIIYKTGDDIIIKLKYHCDIPGEKLNFVLNITRSDWIFVYGTSYTGSYKKYVSAKEDGEVTMKIDNISLLPGTYFMDFRIVNEKKEPLDIIYCLFEFKIEDENQGEVGFMSLKHSISAD